MRRILASLLISFITITLLFAKATIAQSPAVDNTLVVCVSAHPEDIEIATSGSLYKDDIGKHPIMWIVVTDGGADLDEYNYESNASQGWIAQDGQFNVTWEAPDGNNITRPFYSADLAKKRCGGYFEGLNWTVEAASHNSTFGVAYDWQTRVSSFVDPAIEKIQMGYLKQSNPAKRLAYPDAGLTNASTAFRDSIATNLANEINKSVESNGYQKNLVKIYSHGTEEVCTNASEHPDHQVVGNAVRQAIELLLTTYGFGQIDAKWFTVYDPINPKEGYLRVNEDISLQQTLKSELAKLCWETENLYLRRVNYTWTDFPFDPGTYEWSIFHSYYSGRPTVTITSPGNRTYAAKTVDLNWSADEPVSWCAFSLNSAANDTSIGPTRWWSNSTITPSFNIGSESSPTVFQRDGTWYMISGRYDGTFRGFNWTGSGWQIDDATVSGLGSVGSRSHPTVFQKDGTWYMISGEEWGTLGGFNWTGSAWQSDSTIAIGLGDIGTRSTPFVFQKDGTWYLLTGEVYGGFIGFGWNGSVWQNDGTIVSGLGDVGYHSSPTVFQKDGAWYLISGDDAGSFHGYNWTGSMWRSDSAIVSGLGMVAWNSAPEAFEINGICCLISGEFSPNDVGFHGFSWGFGCLNVTITVQDGSNVVTVYAMDVEGNENRTTRYFTVDTTPPGIAVLSPQNMTYDSASVSLTFTVGEPADWIGYSLDDAQNVTIIGNNTLTDLSAGSHSVIVYANDTLGNMGASDGIYFTVCFPDYLVVRGLDHRIYHRSYNSSVGSWESWNAVPYGTTCDSPASALCGNELHFVVRGMDGYTLWHGNVDLETTIFSGWTLLSGSTPSAPTLTSNGTALSLVVRGQNNLIFYRFYTVATRTWTDWAALPLGSTCDSPTAAILANKLNVVVRGMDGLTLWHSSVDLSTGAFSGWDLVGGATESKPTLTVCGARNEIVLVARGLNNVIYRNTWSGSTWAGWIAIPSGSTCDGIGATVIGEALHVIVRGMDGYTLWHGNVDLETTIFSGWTLLSGSTPSPPILAS